MLFMVQGAFILLLLLLISFIFTPIVFFAHFEKPYLKCLKFMGLKLSF